MGESEVSLQLLKELPRALLGGMTLRIVTAGGEILRRAGPDDGTQIRNRAQGIAVEPGEGRAHFQRSLGSGGSTAVLSFDESDEESVVPFVEGLFEMLEQKQIVEEDMESIQPSSLALLEEVSMYNDTLPNLSTGSSEVEVAEMGLQALAVAASLDRAIYVRYDQVADRGEVLVQVGVDDSGRHVVRLPYAHDPILPRGDGIVWDAINGDGDAILRTVPDGTRLGSEGSPEWFAQRDVVAVPVSYGSEEKRVILGVLLVMDKRASAWVDGEETHRLGSQETKFATAIASMLGSVLGARKVAELGKELHMAKAIQRQILPDRPAQIDGFDLAGRCTNSGAVGGDYFDFLPMKDGRTLVVVADVSGHNLASGMLMVGARSTLRALASQHASPSVVFDELTRALYEDLTSTELFITAVAASLTPGGRDIEIVNAGHNDSMIFRHDSGTVERIPSDSTVLGFLPEAMHGRFQAELRDGDVMLLYTDGVVEATNDDGEMLGEERLTEILAGVAAGTAEEILEAVYGAVGNYSSRSSQDDDVTAVVIKAVHQEREEE